MKFVGLLCTTRLQLTIGFQGSDTQGPVNATVLNDSRTEAVS